MASENDGARFRPVAGRVGGGADDIGSRVDRWIDGSMQEASDQGEPSLRVCKAAQRTNVNHNHNHESRIAAKASST